MSAKDLFYPENKEFSKAEDRLFAREDLVYNVTEDILIALEDLNISKKELAGRLGKSRSFVTQVLSGARNMTLGSLSDICFALGIAPKVNFEYPPSAIELTSQFSIEWKETSAQEKSDELIRRSVNVIDCRDERKWENQAA